MHTRKYHKLIGTLMILPMLGWVLTGAVFMLKPGYDEAYASLSVKTYPLDKPLLISPNENWREVKLLRTVLGRHLLVIENGSALHLSADTGKTFPLPPIEQLIALINDAIAHDEQRYGRIKSYELGAAHTSTGVDIDFDWQTLSLQQKGSDTRAINNLYKIHYLQWTPSELANKVLGALGLGLLLILTALGIRLISKS